LNLIKKNVRLDFLFSNIKKKKQFLNLDENGDDLDFDESSIDKTNPSAIKHSTFIFITRKNQTTNISFY